MKVNMRHVQLQSIPGSSEVIILQKLKKSPEAFRQTHGYISWLVLSAKNSFGCCLNHCPQPPAQHQMIWMEGFLYPKIQELYIRSLTICKTSDQLPPHGIRVGLVNSMPQDDGNGHAAIWYRWRVYPDIYSWPWYSFSDIYESKSLHYLCHHVTWSPAAMDPEHFSHPVGMDSSPSTPSLNRDAQIPGARPPERQNFVEWHLTFVGSQ